MEPEHNTPPDGGEPSPAWPPSLTGIDFEDVFVQARVGMALVEPSGRLLRVNEALCSLLGRSTEELLAARPADLIPVDQHPLAARLIAQARAGNPVFQAEMRYDRPDGTSVWALINTFAVLDEAGRNRVIVLHYQDITERRLAAERLAASERRFRSLVQNISETVSLIDAEGRILLTTGNYKPILGYPSAFWEQRSAFDLTHPDDVPRILAGLEQALANPGEEIHDEIRARHADGHWEHLHITAVNLLADPDVKGLVVTTRNITEVTHAQQVAEGQSRVLELIARGESLHDTLAAICAMVAGSTDDATPSIFFVEGDRLICRAGALPQSVVDAVILDPDWRVNTTCGRAIVTGQAVFVDDVMTNPLVATNRSVVAAAGFRSIWAYPVIDSSTNRALGSFATLSTEQRRPSPHEQHVTEIAARLVAVAVERDSAQANMAHQATHDSLTGLPNRTLLLDRLEQAVKRATRLRQPVAVMFLDVDRFKVVNDSLGHTVGDALLVAFSHRLAAVVRPEDTVARFGGDEFVVLCEDVHDEAAVRAVAKRITAALDEPFLVLSGGEVFLTASIGLAIADDRPRGAESLLRDADAAMYRAKDRGRDRLEVFDAEMRAASLLRLSLENDLRRALARNDLVMHYQPTIDLSTGLIVGAEALIRWHHPTRGLLGPDDFIPVAEDTGLVVPIGSWALGQALADVHELIADPVRRPFQLAVNLSGRQLADAHLVDHVSELLAQHAWPADQLCLELTESMITDDIEPAIEILVGLKRLGVLLAIDDFGTGFSSLTRLHQLPVDIVKVDQSFVAGLHQDDDRHAIVTAIVRMVHALGLRTSAEGIETADQLAELRALGCDWGQGFLFSEAVPIDELAVLLADPPTR